MKAPILASALVLLATGIATAQDLPPGYGVESPSGSKFTTELRAADTDDYVFEGYAGAKVTVSVTKPKAVTVDHQVELQRPDGSVVTEQDGLKLKVGKAVKASFVLDATGVWKARVKAPDANGNLYTLKIKYGGPKVPKQKNLVADGDGEFKLSVPAKSGARVTASLRFKGDAPTFVSFRDADGNDVEGFGDALKQSRTKLVAKNFYIPAGHALGDFQLVFADNGATKVSFAVKVKVPKGDKKRNAKLDGNEPAMQSVSTPVGGAGTVLVAIVRDAIDTNDLEGVPGFRVGAVELDGVSVNALPGPGGLFSVQGTVPADVLQFPIGTVFDVQVLTSTGQATVLTGAFELVAPPAVSTIAPSEGSAAGGYSATITGAGFRGRANTLVTIDDFVVPVTIESISATEIVFEVPQRTPGFVQFGVQDAQSQLRARLPVGSFEYLPTPGINRVTPGLVSILGGEPIFVSGAFFDSDDKVLMEREDGSFEDISLSQSTYVDDELHSFDAPVRAKGTYEIYVEDTQGIRSAGRFEVSYFTYSDFTASTGLNGGSDLYDGVTTTVADYDGDGDEDLFIARKGGGSVASSPETRVLENDGDGGLTDVTASVMPATTTKDDWRADRIWVTDVTEDGYPDIVIVTNSTTVPANDESHVRILVSVPRSGGTGAEDRVFLDRTKDLFALPRSMTQGAGGGNVLRDNWRGLDMWIGDLDFGSGPPDIVITHDELKSEYDVLCGNYCASPYSGAAFYNFYWGGSRAFRWNPEGNNGEGQYEFDFTFFPRKQGLSVPVPNIPNCNSATPCKGQFTPFVGQRVTGGLIDTDGRSDIAVLSNATVQAFGSDTSSLQVLLNRLNPQTLEPYTDLTPLVHATGGDTRGDAVAIGYPGYPDGNGFAFIATSKATAAAGASRVLRMYKYTLQGTATHDIDDVSSRMLPGSTSNDSWQASALRFVDVDDDGDQDLVLLANQPPGLTDPGFRILRNVVVSGETGVMREQFRPLITALASGNDKFAGDALSIGDMDGDEALDFYVTRATPVGLDSQTRVIKTDK